MHKIFFFASIVLLTVIILPQLQLASAQEIPKNLRNEIKLWANNQADNDNFLSTIAELRQSGFLKFNPSSADSLKDTYYLPASGTTQFVQIQGRTPNVGQTNPITIIVTNPERVTQELSIPVLESGAYYTTIQLDHNSPLGKYEIVAYHGNKQIRSSEFYLVKSAAIPAWIKSAAHWWVEDKISDQEFLDGLDYLIKNNIIVTVTTDNITDTLDVTIDGQKAVRRGTTQDLSIHVQNSKGDVDGATVFVRVEDYGENVVEKFKGITDSNGNYDVSWEISKDIPNLKTFLVFVDVTDGISSETKVFTFQVYCLCGEPNCKCRN